MWRVEIFVEQNFSKTFTAPILAVNYTTDKYSDFFCNTKTRFSMASNCLESDGRFVIDLLKTLRRKSKCFTNRDFT